MTEIYISVTVNVGNVSGSALIIGGEDNRAEVFSPAASPELSEVIRIALETIFAAGASQSSEM